MNLYTDIELEKIAKLKETNDRLEEFFELQRKEWTNNIDPLSQSLNLSNGALSSEKITHTLSYCLSYRQALNEQASKYLDRLSKQDVKLKKLRQEKFIWYATGFGIKTNMGEKTILIDAHVAEEQRNIELIQNYIEFLRQTNKNLESMQFSIKNIIELFNYLSK